MKDTKIADQAHISWIEYTEEAESYYLITSLFVPAHERRQGKARQLLRDALKEMKEDGKQNVVKLTADSSSVDSEEPIDNADLCDFYESEGFDLVMAGDIIVMEATL